MRTRFKNPTEPPQPRLCRRGALAHKGRAGRAAPDPRPVGRAERREAARYRSGLVAAAQHRSSDRSRSQRPPPPPPGTTAPPDRDSCSPSPVGARPSPALRGCRDGTGGGATPPTLLPGTPGPQREARHVSIYKVYI